MSASTLSGAIRAVLARDPQTEWRPRDVRDALGLDENTRRIAATLGNMTVTGLVVRTSQGRYRLGRAPLYEGRSAHEGSSYAAEAARHLLDGLRRRRFRVASVDEAIRRALLTDLEWCVVLDEFRERHGPTFRPAPPPDHFPHLPRRGA